MKKEFDEYDLLVLRWAALTTEATLEKKFERDEFISLFKETFAVIRKYSVSQTIERKIMELVFTISGFVATKLVDIGYAHIAATELAEAMLHCCLYEEPHEQEIDKGKWFIFYNVDLDFTDPEGMLLYLATYFEDSDSISPDNFADDC